MARSKKKKIAHLVTEVREHGEKWAVHLKREHCSTEEPVIYGVATLKATADIISQRFNDNARQDAEWEAEERERRRLEKEAAEKEEGDMADVQ
tara:strand:- start:2683 stop:2961 length:279 start_codon:yes stop_codon:yes gene_type:complete